MSKQDVYEQILRPMRTVFGAPSQMAKADEDAALEEYASALSRYDYRDLAAGWSKIRESHKRPFWPPPALIVEAVQHAQTERFAATPKKQKLQGRMVDGVVQPWGGACQCRRCVEKIPRPEFFKAPSSAYQRDEAIRSELDYDMERRCGYDPKRGNPDLDNSTERHRSPAELAALLASVRKRYFRAFKPGLAEFATEREPIPFEESDPELLAEMRDRISSKQPAPESVE